MRHRSRTQQPPRSRVALYIPVSERERYALRLRALKERTTLIAIVRSALDLPADVPSRSRP
jgi:hypothetical protein